MPICQTGDSKCQFRPPRTRIQARSSARGPWRKNVTPDQSFGTLNLISLIRTPLRSCSMESRRNEFMTLQCLSSSSSIHQFLPKDPKGTNGFLWKSKNREKSPCDLLDRGWSSLILWARPSWSWCLQYPIHIPWTGEVNKKPQLPMSWVQTPTVSVGWSLAMSSHADLHLSTHPGRFIFIRRCPIHESTPKSSK